MLIANIYHKGDLTGVIEISNNPVKLIRRFEGFMFKLLNKLPSRDSYIVLEEIED